MKKYLSIVFLIIAIVSTIVSPIYAGEEINNIKAKVVEAKEIEEIVKENEPTKKVQNIIVRILEGEYENEEYEMVYVISENIDNMISNIELKEDDNILITIQEEEGEVVNIIYNSTINSNYSIYIISAILIILLLIVNRKRAIIFYLLSIILVISVFIFSIKWKWNLILATSILSVIITMILYISIDKINKGTLGMILKAILGIFISGLGMYLIFDIIGFNNINIRIAENFINIKDLFVSTAILIGTGIYNAISISAQYIFYATNKPYKTKSDNIIEGQRSLKL